ncbi:unnamed protein product [Gadus morhua 'NCC']
MLKLKSYATTIGAKGYPDELSRSEDYPALGLQAKVPGNLFQPCAISCVYHAASSRLSDRGSEPVSRAPPRTLSTRSAEAGDGRAAAFFLHVSTTDLSHTGSSQHDIGQTHHSTKRAIYWQNILTRALRISSFFYGSSHSPYESAQARFTADLQACLVPRGI